MHRVLLRIFRFQIWWKIYPSRCYCPFPRLKLPRLAFSLFFPAIDTVILKLHWLSLIHLYDHDIFLMYFTVLALRVIPYLLFKEMTGIPSGTLCPLSPGTWIKKKKRKLAQTTFQSLFPVVSGFDLSLHTVPRPHLISSIHVVKWGDCYHPPSPVITSYIGRCSHRWRNNRWWFHPLDVSPFPFFRSFLFF